MAEKKIRTDKEESNMWRPQKYTPDSLYDKAMEYFKQCEDTILETSYWKKIPTPKTLSWLCLYLWVSKDYISEKAKDKNFSEMIWLIRAEVENDIELNAMLWFYNATIASKNLSANFNWVEKSSVDNTNTNYEIQENSLSEEQKKLIAKRYGNN